VPRPDQIFAGGGIHSRLAPDGAVDLGQQRRRHLHTRDPAVIDRRHKSRQVAHHPAAHRGNERRTIQSRGNHSIANRFRLLHRLRRLPGLDRDQYRPNARFSQAAHNWARVKCGDVLIRNYRAGRSFDFRREQRTDARQNSAVDNDLITLFASLDADPIHGVKRTGAPPHAKAKTRRR